MTFSEKLVILRKKYGLTQDDLAKQLGVSRQSVYKWECGQSYPEVPKLLELKLQFNISIDDLLDDNYEMPLPEKKKKKRLSKETIKKIEESVEAKIGITRAEPAPVLAEVKPEPMAEEVKAEAPAPVAEPEVAEQNEVKEEKEAAPAPEKEVKTEKKIGFFGKIFGKK